MDKDTYLILRVTGLEQVAFDPFSAPVWRSGRERVARLLRALAVAAASPAKPPPTITTRCAISAFRIMPPKTGVKLCEEMCTTRLLSASDARTAASSFLR